MALELLFIFLSMIVGIAILAGIQKILHDVEEKSLVSLVAVLVAIVGGITTYHVLIWISEKIWH